MSCPTFEVGYGGAKGGGKSHVLLLDFLSQCEHPMARGIVFRRTTPELEDLVDKSYRIYQHLGARFHITSRTWMFPSGATLKMRHMNEDEDWKRYQGHEYSWVGIDEAQHFTQEQVQQIRSCCRLKRPGLDNFFRLTFNPGGILHDYLRARFYDPCPSGHIVLTEEGEFEGKKRVIEREFHPARITDNPWLLQDDSYIANLATLTPHLKRLYLLGDWDAMTSGYFSNFNKDIHVLSWKQLRNIYGIKPGGGFPSNWTHGRSFDDGYGHPFAHLWYCFTDDGRIIFYQEYYGAKLNSNNTYIGLRMDTNLIAESIKRMDWPKIDYTMNVADTRIFAKNGNGNSTAEILQNEGLYYVGANKERIQGWRRVSQYLTPVKHYMLSESDKDMKAPPGSTILNGKKMGKYGSICRPKMYILDTCKHLIRCLAKLPPDPKDPDDVDTTSEDHICDAARYACMMRSITYSNEEEDSLADIDSLDYMHR